MERLGIKIIEGEYPRIILYNSDEVYLEIYFANNLDLYFIFNGANKSQMFKIDESNLRVYDIFNKLYNDLIDCKLPFDSSKERLRRLTNYSLLVQNNIITWKSDDYPFDIGPSFKIEKVSDIINSGSLYQPFNTNFMKLYHELCNLDLEQIYIDEIMDLRRIKK